MNETNSSTMERLRLMQEGHLCIFSPDEMRILKTLDRAGEIRSRPWRPPENVDASPHWEAWFEWQIVHETDLQQITGRLPKSP